VVEKELGFGEGRLLHKLCKVTYSLNSHTWYNNMNAICSVLLQIKGSLLHRFICSYPVGG
jgi:hypothetical protein